MPTYKDLMYSGGASLGDALAKGLGDAATDRQNNAAALQRQQQAQQAELQALPAKTQAAVDTERGKQGVSLETLAKYKALGVGGKSQKAGDLSIGEQPDNTMSNLMKEEALKSRHDKQLASETNNLTNTFDKQNEDSLKSLKQAQMSKALIQENTIWTKGPEQLSYVKSMVNRLAAQELAYGAPTTATSKAKEWLAKYIPGQTDTKILDPEVQQGMMRALDVESGVHQNHLRDSYARMEANAKRLAPYSDRSGVLPDTLKALRDHAETISGGPMHVDKQQANGQQQQQNIVSVPQPQQPATGMTGLKNWFKGTFSPSQSAATQQPAMQQSPQGGFDVSKPLDPNSGTPEQRAARMQYLEQNRGLGGK